jgi:hypothetical protein
MGGRILIEVDRFYLILGVMQASIMIIGMVLDDSGLTAFGAFNIMWTAMCRGMIYYE